MEKIIKIKETNGHITLVSGLNIKTINGESILGEGDINVASGDVDALIDDVNNIKALIPTQATEQNQLVDKDFVNSSIATNTADFKGTFNSVNALPTTGVDANDYAFVVSTDTAGNTLYTRYKYTNSGWQSEYVLNNSSFTAAQWAAIQSGITAGIVQNLHDSDKLVRGEVVHNIVTLTQAQYDALATKDANTEYNIIESV